MSNLKRMNNLNDLGVLNEEYDIYFTIIGKALYIASDFESDVKAISTYFNIIEKRAFFEDDNAFNEFLKVLGKFRHLSKDVKKLPVLPELKEIFHEAKNFRNEIAHALSLGIENYDTDEESIKIFIEDNKGAILTIIKASFFTKLITHNLINKEEIFLTSDWIDRKYNWVINNI